MVSRADVGDGESLHKSSSLFLSHPRLDPLLQLRDCRNKSRIWGETHKQKQNSFLLLLSTAYVDYAALPASHVTVKGHHGGVATWLQHALCEWLSVEGVSRGVEQVAQDDGTVHDVPRGQYHRVSHQCVHQRIYHNTDIHAVGLIHKQWSNEQKAVTMPISWPCWFLASVLHCNWEIWSSSIIGTCISAQWKVMLLYPI